MTCAVARFGFSSSARRIFGVPPRPRRAQSARRRDEREAKLPLASGELTASIPSRDVCPEGTSHYPVAHSWVAPLTRHSPMDASRFPAA